MKEVAGECRVQHTTQQESGCVNSPTLRVVRHERKQCQDNTRPMVLSKQIQKEVRQQLRKVKSAKVSAKLQNFRHLDDLHAVHKSLVMQKGGGKVRASPSTVDFLAGIFHRDDLQVLPHQLEELQQIPEILCEEV